MSGPGQDAGELYRAHAPFVAGFLMRLGAPEGELVDLVQEVFLVAHRRGGFTPGPAKATTWLAEIAIRTLSNHRRTTRRRPASVQAEPAAVAHDDPEARAGARRALHRVNACLEGLDMGHRSVFVLYELEGVACPEIAASLGVPLGTVHRRLHTARKRFREAYERAGGRRDE